MVIHINQVETVAVKESVTTGRTEVGLTCGLTKRVLSKKTTKISWQDAKKKGGGDEAWISIQDMHTSKYASFGLT